MERDFRIDVLRAFACIMVLFCHAPQPLFNQSGAIFVGIVNYFGMSWGPILFFMISGACILWKEREAVPFFKRRFSKILVPTVLWSIVYILIESFWWKTSPSDAWLTKIPSIIMGPQYSLMWFMYALIALYLITPILSKWLAKSNKSEICVYLMIWMLSLCVPYLTLIGIDGSEMFNQTNIFYYFMGFACYAVLGYFCRKYVVGLKLTFGRVMLILLILLTPAYYYVIKYFTGQVFTSSHCLFQMLTTGLAFVGIYNLKMPRIISEGKGAAFIENISKLSFGIYLTHMVFMYPFRIWIAQFNLHYALQLPITVLVVFVLSYISSLLIYKLPFGKYIIG